VNLEVSVASSSRRRPRGVGVGGEGHEDGADRGSPREDANALTRRWFRDDDFALARIAAGVGRSGTALGLNPDKATCDR
jgi:hypothetical protein